MNKFRASKRVNQAASRLLVLLILTAIKIQWSMAVEHTSATSFHGAPAPQPQPGSVFMFPERIKQSSGGFINAERGLVFVPLNRANKDADVIAVEIYRFKRNKKANPETPPIFYLPGGPGYGGLEKLLERNPNYYQKRIKPHLKNTDFIVVSQRGIGPSKPTTTIETTMSKRPIDKPFDSEFRAKELQRVLEKERVAWDKLGVDLKGYNVIEAGEDINDIRLALGYSKITLWGGSFGSHWAMAMMRLHPEAVARAILWGMEGPDHTYDHPGQIWDVYKRVAKEAEKSKQLKPFIPKEGLIAAVETIINRVDQKPFTIQVSDAATNQLYDVLIDSKVIRDLIQGYSEEGLEAWPADIIRMYNGNFKGASEFYLKWHQSGGKRFSTASYYMLDCGSGITKKRLKVFREDPSSDYIPHRNWTYSSGCPVWKSDLGDEFRQNFYTEIPTVIIQGSWDLYTPYENAVELLPYFKNSKFVTVQAGPHWAVGSAMEHSSAFDRGIREFVTSGNFKDIPELVELPNVSWVIPKEISAKESGYSASKR